MLIGTIIDGRQVVLSTEHTTAGDSGISIYMPVVDPKHGDVITFYPSLVGMSIERYGKVGTIAGVRNMHPREIIFGVVWGGKKQAIELT